MRGRWQIQAGSVLIALLMCAGCQDRQAQALAEAGLSTVQEETSQDQEASQEQETSQEQDTEAETETGDMIVVDVCGAVKTPGVYELPAGSRVYEAIALAGGMTKDASASSINQAGRLTDEQQIYVPSEQEIADGTVQTKSTGGASAASGEDSGKININTATGEELMTLSGIGESRAAAIIQYREEHGAFQSPEEIKNVSGIKDGLYQKLKDDITV